MPQLVICHKCGAILYESIDDLKAPDEIIQSHDGKCSACGKKLSYIPKNVEVKPFDARNRLNPFEPQKEKPSRTESGIRTKKRARKRSGYVSSRPKSGGIWGTG